MGGRAPALVPTSALVLGVLASRGLDRVLPAGPLSACPLPPCLEAGAPAHALFAPPATVVPATVVPVTVAPVAVMLPLVVLPLVVLLLGALLSRGVSRRAAVASAAGWLLGLTSGASDRPFEAIDPDRPVEVTAHPLERWRASPAGWSTWLEVESLLQGAARPGAESRGAASRPTRIPGRVPALRVTLVSSEAPPEGRRLVLRGYLRAPRPYLNGTSSGAPGPWSVSVSSPRLIRVAEPYRWAAAARRVRALRTEVDRRLERRAGEGGALARGLLLGDASRLDPRHLIAFRRLGLGHLVAVSGLHLALVLALVWVSVAWTGRHARLAISALAMACYCLLVGYRPSLVRAALMASSGLVSLATERRPDGLNAWALAGGLMVAFRPALVDDVGFQLTVAATLALIVVAPPLSRRWRPLLGALPARALAASVAAHLATLPWAVGIFHLWSPGSILLNLLAVPWAAIALPLALAAVVVEPLAGLGDAAWAMFEAVSRPFEWLVRIPPGLPWSIATSRPWWCLVVLSLLLSRALCRWRPLPVVALSGASVAALLALPPGGGDTGAGRHAGVNGPELLLIDVGQGDAILLRDADRAMLIDGGGWLGAGIGQRVLLPVLLDQGLRRLDGIVLTHPDRDHCAGLLELASLVPVERLWSATGWSDACYRELLATPGPVLSPLWRGRRLRLGGWSLEVLHPAAGGPRRGNDSSVVLHAAHGRWAVLLTGDIGGAAEASLISASGSRLAATVLKVAHHGSRHSSTAAFLDRVAPRLALISCGRDNVYGHPSEAVLARLRERGVDVRRTDHGGLVRLRLGEALRAEQPGEP